MIGRSFLIYSGATDLLGGMDIAALVACLTGLLKHTHLVTSPPVHQSIVQLLLAMLSPQVGGAGGLGGGAGCGAWRLAASPSLQHTRRAAHPATVHRCSWTTGAWRTEGRWARAACRPPRLRW